MSTTITLDDMRDLIEDGTPAEEGIRLAKMLLSRDDVDWDDISIDVRSMPIELLNVTFFYGFLQRVADSKPELLERARGVKWRFSNRSLEETNGILISQFRPRPTKTAA
jgi:hypothetical protein